ncbi:MAG: glycosyltransferase [Nanoarchaeota archaeon]|nr:glycosyltransferase [Nanoarchaeota archaeon]
MNLSVIVPAYNSRSLSRSVESIFVSLGNARLSSEILVCDDCSSDDTMQELRKKYPTVKVFSLSSRKGAAAARNLGISNSGADILFFMDSDILLNNHTIKTMAEALKSADIVFPKITMESGRLFYPVLKQEESYPIVSACFMMKKSSLSKMDEGFDEHYGTYLEDCDFFMRAKLTGLSASYCKEAHVVHVDKGERDFSERYFLELKNTLYGHAKLGKLPLRTGLYNPFSLRVYIKEVLYGLMNYAWFNWEKADRDQVRLKGNRIFKGTGLSAIPIILRSIRSHSKDIKKTRKKAEEIRKFYGKS